MAYYKNGEWVKETQTGALDDYFKGTYAPGEETPHSGIYHCDVCGFEVVSTKGNPLPTQDHSEHDTSKRGPIKWRLIVLPFHKRLG
jgi:hypothetical protein